MLILANMEFLQWLLQITQGFEFLIYMAAFFFAASESTIGLSMLVPGSLTLMLIGALSALGKFKIYIILPIAIVGAIVGDNISYLLGKKFGWKIVSKVKFIDKKMLKEAEKFIHKHGPKSVVLGRFVPFVKETIPFIAGTLKMDRKKFMLYNALGAFGWAFMWPGTGYMFAKAVLNGNSAISAIQLSVAFFIFSYLIFLIIKDTLLNEKFAPLKKTVLGILSKKKVLFILATVISLYTLFLMLAIAVLEQKALISVMDYIGIKYLFSDFNKTLYLFFKYFTWTGKWFVFVPIIFILTLIFYKRERLKFILSLWFTILGSAFSVFVIKHIVGRPRPGFMRIHESGMSFPSGHATMATALSGILIFFLLQLKKSKYRFIIISALMLWAFLIYASRIYLGVHYMSDILGGVILGMIFTIFGASLYIWMESKEYASDISVRFSGSVREPVKNDKSMQDLSIKSTIFKDGEFVPSKYTCDGENINPELLIDGVPRDTKSLALIMDDPDVPKELRSDGHFTHWLLYNIDPSLRKIKENSAPGTQGKNDAGQNTYTGPCPPTNYEPTKHRYFFKLYALDSLLDLPEGASQKELEEAMQGHILAQAELMAYYDRAR